MTELSDRRVAIVATKDAGATAELLSISAKVVEGCAEGRHFERPVGHLPH